jgi:hypothetical protein
VKEEYSRERVFEVDSKKFKKLPLSGVYLKSLAKYWARLFLILR